MSDDNFERDAIKALSILTATICLAFVTSEVAMMTHKVTKQLSCERIYSPAECYRRLK